MRQRSLKWIAKNSNHHPYIIICLAILLTIVSGYIASDLRIVVDSIRLMPDSLPAIINYNAAKEEFGDFDNMILAIEGPDPAVSRQIVDLLTKNIEQLPDVSYIKSRMLDENDENKLLFLEVDELTQLERQLRKLKSAAIASSNPLLMGMSKQLKRSFNLNKLFERLDDNYITSKDGQMLLLLVFINKLPESMSYDMRIIDNINDAIRKSNLPAFGEGYSVRVTGRNIYHLEQQVAMEEDMRFTSLFSFVGVLLLFVVSFKLLTAPLLVGIALAMGICWTMGLVTVIIGSLNPITTTFSAVLIGLGVDFAIHMIARFTEERINGAPIDEAMETMLLKTGNASLTGAVTTSGAFFVLYFTEFKGLSELGLIASFGILICLFAMYIILPALLSIRYRFTHKPPRNRHTLNLAPIEANSCFYRKNYRAILLISALIIFAIGSNVTGLTFENSFSNLHDPTTSSYKLDKELIRRFGISRDYAMVISPDIASAQKLHTAFHSSEYKTISYMDSIVNYSQVALHDKYEVISRIKKRLDTFNFPFFLNKLEREYLNTLKTYVNAASSNHQLNLSPHSQQRYIGKTGQVLSFLYPKRDLWEDDQVFDFDQEVSELTKIVPGLKVTGTASFFVALKKVVIKDFEFAAGASLLLVFIILLIDFRNLKNTLLCMTPLVTGILCMLGTMVITGIKLDLFNVAITPLVIGIGIDDGVHLVHRYLSDGSTNISNVVRTTGRSITLTSLTTMIGFSSLTFSNYGGLYSMGAVSLYGIAFCLLASLLVLPAIISYLEHRKCSE